MPRRIVIEIHRHGRLEVDRDITAFVTKAVWSRSLSAPWQSLSVTWKAPLGDSFSRVLPGDWLVFRVLSSSIQLGAMLCRVTKIRGGTQMAGATHISTPSSFEAVGWWAFLSKTKVFTPTGWTESTGTLFSMKDWWEKIVATDVDIFQGRIGDSLARLFRVLAAVKLPESLTGGTPLTLGDVVPVVHNKETRDRFAANRVVESVDIGGGPPGYLAPTWVMSQASVGDFITGAYVPEPMLMELFPSFEPLAGQPPSQQSFAGEALYELLGGWETLIYRIKPFRTRPLRESAVAWAEYKHTETEKQMVQALAASALSPARALARAATEAAEKFTAPTNTRVNLLTSAFFREVTWDYLKAVSIPLRMVRSFDAELNDERRLNCATIQLSLDGSETFTAWPQAGLPIRYDEEIRRHGLRLAMPHWTFTFPPKIEAPDDQMSYADKISPNTSVDFLSYLRTIAAQYMQFYKNHHLYGEGSVSINFTEALNATEGADALRIDQVLKLKPGEILSIDFAKEPYFAYTETIRHTFTVHDGGIESADTSISFSHGHFGVSDDVLSRAVEVPINATQPSGEVSPQGPGSPTVYGGTPRAPVDSGRFTCRDGRPAASFPQDYVFNYLNGPPVGSLDNPSANWLVPWAVKRGVSPKYFNLSTERAGGISNPFDSRWVLDPTRVGQRFHVAMACAFIVERYWRLQYPEARIKFVGGGPLIRNPVGAGLSRDPSQNHISGSAFDFAIYLTPTVVAPVLQTWASLVRLGNAKRIPRGAVGLYLNAAPDTGIKGTAWEQAGLPAIRGQSPGSSSGTHYDFRGSYTRMSNPRRIPGYPLHNATWPEFRSGTQYLWVNTDGLGTSDLVGPAAIEFLTFKLPSVLAYYLTQGNLDTTLWSAESEFIPNTEQLLGNEESCFMEGENL